MINFSEVIKIKDGIIYNLDLHQERVDRTLKALSKGKIDLSVINNNISEKNLIGLYKCRVVYSDKIESINFEPYTFRTIRTAAFVYDDIISYSYKYCDRSHLDILKNRTECDEILIVKNDLLTDSSFSNLVFSKGDIYYTPNTYLLAGTKRTQLISNKSIIETEIAVQDLDCFEYLYFINAMIDLDDQIRIKVCNIKNLQ